MKTDLIVLGGGPAGLTAAIYAARARIPLLLVEKGLTGGQMAATEYVDNYPGFPEPVLGFDLAQKMEAQARKFGAEIVYSEINKIEQSDAGFKLVPESGDPLEARAVVLATGASPVKLGIPGELELAGKGVSYCAVCDGPFFSGFEVAVVGGGDSAVEEAIYLTRFATKVHLIHRRDELRAVKEIQERAFNEPKIEFHWSYAPTEITGDREVQNVKIKSTKDGSEKSLPVGGIFFYVGLYPNSSAFNNLVEADKKGFIVTDEKMATTRKGIWAAGDVRVKSLRQISTAIGDGAIAAHSAQQYLEGH